MYQVGSSQQHARQGSDSSDWVVGLGPLLQLPGDITEAARTLARTPQSKRILLERTVWTENPELYVLHDALGIFFLLWPARSVPSISGNGVAGISFFILCAVLRWVGAAGLAAGGRLYLQYLSWGVDLLFGSTWWK